MMKDYINIDKDMLSGNPVFKSTRVLVERLFFRMKKGIFINEFLEDFPSVTKAPAIAVMEMASKMPTL